MLNQGKAYQDNIENIMRAIKMAYENEEYEKIIELMEQRHEQITALINVVAVTERDSLLHYLQEIHNVDREMRASISEQMDGIARTFKAKKQLKAYLA